MATFASFFVFSPSFSSSKHDKSLSDSSVKQVKFKRKRYFFNSDEPFLQCANSINIYRLFSGERYLYAVICR